MVKRKKRKKKTAPKTPKKRRAPRPKPRKHLRKKRPVHPRVVRRLQWAPAKSLLRAIGATLETPYDLAMEAAYAAAKPVRRKKKKRAPKPPPEKKRKKPAPPPEPEEVVEPEEKEAPPRERLQPYTLRTGAEVIDSPVVLYATHFNVTPPSILTLHGFIDPTLEGGFFSNLLAKSDYEADDVFIEAHGFQIRPLEGQFVHDPMFKNLRAWIWQNAREVDLTVIDEGAKQEVLVLKWFVDGSYRHAENQIPRLLEIFEEVFAFFNMEFADVWWNYFLQTTEVFSDTNTIYKTTRQQLTKKGQRWRPNPRLRPQQS